MVDFFTPYLLIVKFLSFFSFAFLKGGGGEEEIGCRDYIKFVANISSTNFGIWM